MIYTTKQIEILKILQSGKSRTEAATALGMNYHTVFKRVARFRRRNNLKRSADFERFLQSAIIPDKPPVKKYQSIYQMPSGAWSPRIVVNGHYRRLVSFIDKQKAYERRQAVLANPQLLKPLRSRTLPKGVYPFRDRYMVKLWRNGKQIYLGVRKTVEESVALYNDFVENGTTVHSR